MKRLVCALTLLLSSSAFAQTVSWTTSGPQWVLDANGRTYPTQTACVTAAQQLGPGTYHCHDMGVETITGVAAMTPTPPTQPPTGTTSTAPSGSTKWGYYNGQYSWAGDWSYAATINYEDTAGSPIEGPYDIAVRSSAWGAWQPYMSSSFSFPTAGYSKLTFALKPTSSAQNWQIYFMGVGDVNLNCTRPLSNYITTPIVGHWNVYTIPLSDLCVGGGINVYKFAIQEESGGTSTWYIDNVGYTN
jgi:hypothetical protein